MNKLSEAFSSVLRFFSGNVEVLRNKILKTKESMSEKWDSKRSSVGFFQGNPKLYAFNAGVGLLALIITIGAAYSGYGVDLTGAVDEVEDTVVYERTDFSAFLTYPQPTQGITSALTSVEQDVMEDEDEEVIVIPLGAGDSSNVLVQEGMRYLTEAELRHGLLKELIPLAPAFIEAQEQYGIDAVFLSAIAALESGWGTRPMYNTNLFGFGNMRFESREAGVAHVAEFLRDEYLTEGGDYYMGVSVEKVGEFYCPNSATWDTSVARIMSEIVSRAEDTAIVPESSYMVLYFPYEVDSENAQRLREYIAKRELDSWADTDIEPLEGSLQAKQLERIANLRALGVVLPDYDGWGTNTPRLYDIRLSDELQYYALEMCVAYGVGDHFELMLGKMFRESGFNPRVISATNDYGISQINGCNHGWLRRELGITDFLSAEQSMLCGIHMMSDYLIRFGEFGDAGVHRALMSYNLGEGSATNRWNNGTRSTGYSRRVVETRDNLLEVGTVYR